MMKRLLLAFALIGVFVTSSAQEPKFFLVNTDGVNLREQPNTSSRKLMEVEDAYITYSFSRGSNPARLRSQYPYYSPARQGEWTQLICEDPTGKSFRVWVMSKFLNEVSPGRITSASQLDRMARNLGIEDWMKVRTTSPGQGLVFVINEYDGGGEIYYGSVDASKGCIAFKSRADYYDDCDNYKLVIGDYRSPGLRYNSNQLKVLNQDGYTFGVWDINKFTDKQVKELCSKIDSAPRSKATGTYLYYFPHSLELPFQDGIWQWLTLQ